MLVLCFIIGLAITVVTVGAAEAIGARQAPHLSSVLIIDIGLCVGAAAAEPAVRSRMLAFPYLCRNSRTGLSSKRQNLLAIACSGM
jgi:nickel/cobalt exporter